MNVITNLPNLLPTISGLDAGVAWLISIFGSIWLGVIIFTLVLKIVTLPLDYFSRASMRKMSVKMERMRPELEKLQAQYADNKEMYNQKMMALYKKENVNIFGSCLPTIITLVVFMIVLSSFNNFSNYRNQKNYYDMVTAYNSVVYNGIDFDSEYGSRITVLPDDKGTLKEVDQIYFFNDYIYTKSNGVNSSWLMTEKGENFNVQYVEDGSGSGYAYYYTDSSYIQVGAHFTKNSEGKYDFGENKTTQYVYFVRSAILQGNHDIKNSDGQDFETYCTANGLAINDENGVTFLTNVCQTASKNKYNETKEGFLWINNIWQPDSALQKEVPQTWSNYNSYETVTALMTEEKNTVNGYFIMIVLTAGFTVLQQLVMNKSQKAQMELQSVNGQGAMTQKVMLWMMPMMMGFFALAWTSALAIYIIISSIFSICSTFVINKAVDVSLAKEDALKASKTANRSTKKTVVKKETAPKKDKKNKLPENDFLTYDPNKKYNEKTEEVGALTEEEKIERDKKRLQSMSKKKAKQIKDANKKQNSEERKKEREINKNQTPEE